MACSLPNGDIIFASGEYLTSEKMNKFSGNQSSIAAFLNALNITVNDATFTIQKNGTTVATFTANSSVNKTANISVPTTVEELSDSSNYAKTTDIPTVENATITVTQGGETLGSFTTNQGTDATINLLIDSELSSTSHLPVENAVITSAINEINEELGDLELALQSINGDTENVSSGTVSGDESESESESGNNSGGGGGMSVSPDR